MTLLSEIYDVTIKRGIREANKNGFIRPSIGEHFMTHKDFKEINQKTFTGEYTANKCVGGTVSASGGFLPSKAFDGATSTSYLNWNTRAWNFTNLPATPPWIQYQFTEAQQIEKLVMYNSINTNGVEGVASFVLYGSNDGNTFTEITTGNRRNSGLAGAESFTFENSRSYLIYRFQTTFYGTVGDSGASLYELQMMEGIYV